MLKPNIMQCNNTQLQLHEISWGAKTNLAGYLGGRVKGKGH